MTDHGVDFFGFSNEPTRVGGDGGGAVPAHGLAPGVRIGDLELLRQIGRGAQGVVYEGRRDGATRTLAVKTVAKDGTLGDEQLERFRREAEATGRLDHPNIVAVEGLRETEHYLLLLQEFVEGGDLADALRAGDDGAPPDAARIRAATEIVRKLADALQHAHEHGVIHRDVKPENVLLTPAGEPKLTDFGLARMGDKLGLSRTGEIMGTPHYMSPEQVAANPRGIDARTDVYSLGALLYRFLTGRVPLEAKTLQGTFHQILMVPPRPLRGVNPHVPAELEAVCLKALRKSPDERYASAGDFAADLARQLEGRKTLARPEGPIVRTARLLKRQSTPTLALVALLLPVVWIALDALVLAPILSEEFVGNATRMALLGGVALLFAWPLSLLLARWWGRKRLALAASGVIALALAGLGGWNIREQGLDQLQGVDRARLEARLEEEPVGSRPDVNDLVDYVARWETRFGPLDALLVARGYLKRERPLQAAEWSERLDAALLDTPVHDALRMAVADTLGRSDEAAAAEARLAGERDADWAAWKLAGDILRDMGRPDAAIDAYLRAGRRPDAPRDELNLQLAQVSADLCRWPDVDEYLDDYRKWFPDDPTGQLVVFRAAAGQRDWAQAQASLDAFRASPAASAAQSLRLQCQLWGLQGLWGERWDLVRGAVERHPDDGSLLGWCGQQALEQQRLELAAAGAAAASGDADGAQAALARASAALDVAESAYRDLAEQDDGRFSAELGLSAVAIKRADVDRERRLEWLERAREHAEAARGIDPSYWQAHYNLGHAKLNASRTRAGSFDAVPLPELQEYAALMRAAIARNGLQYQPLNNAAFVLGRYVHAATGEPADLADALELAQRAVRLTDPSRAGEGCARTRDELAVHSSAFDTLRSLQEIAGETDAALLSAERARDVLPDGDPDRARRDAEVARLQALVDAAR